MIESILLSIATLGGVASLIMGLLKKASAWVNRQPNLVKSLIVVVISAVVVVIGKFSGIANLSQDFGAWDAQTIGTILTALVAFGWHALKKSATNSVTTQP